MSFSGLPFAWVLGITVAAVGVLTSLHILRMLALRQRVVTTMFYRHVPLQTQTARLWERFRYPGTYLFLLVIVLLLGWALAGPSWQEERFTPVVIIIDADGLSAPQTEDWTAVQEQAKHLVRGIPVETPVTVVIADPAPRVILDKSEPHASLGVRLAQVSVTKATANAEYSLQFAKSQLGGQPGKIWWLSKQPVGTMGAEITAIKSGTSSTIGAAVVGVHFEAAKNGLGGVTGTKQTGQAVVRAIRWSSVGGAKTDTLNLELKQDQQMVAQVSQALDAVGACEFVIPNIEPAGQTFSYELVDGTSGSRLAQGQWTAPRLGQPEIMVVGNIPEPLRLAGLAVGKLVTTPSERTLLLTVNPAPANYPGPVIQVVSGGMQVTPGLVQGVGAMTKLIFDGARCGVGANLAYGTPWLQVGDKSLAAVGKQGKATYPTLFLSDALFSTGSEVYRRPGFFALISEFAIPTTQARVVFPTYASSYVTAHPELREEHTNMVVAGRGEVPVVNLAEANSQEVPGGNWWSAWYLYQWVLLVVGVLLIVETVLYVRGRIV